MKPVSKTKKVISTIVNITVSIFLFISVLIVLSHPIVWLTNIVMFYMNLSAIFLFIMAIGASKKDKEKLRNAKVIPLWVDETYDMVLAFLFAMAGWWYYAILCVIIVICEIAVYSKVGHEQESVE